MLYISVPNVPNFPAVSSLVLLINFVVHLLQDEELKLSGSVAAGSEVTDLVADLTVGKSDDAESIADSMLGSQSVISEATSTDVSKSSHVST